MHKFRSAKIRLTNCVHTICSNSLISFLGNGQKNGTSPPSSATSEKNTAVSKGDINISTIPTEPANPSVCNGLEPGSQSDNQNSSNSNDEQTESCDKMTSSEKNVRFSDSKNAGNISQEGEMTAAEE